MKKVLYFVLLLAVGALALTGCEEKFSGDNGRVTVLNQTGGQVDFTMSGPQYFSSIIPNDQSYTFSDVPAGTYSYKYYRSNGEMSSTKTITVPASKHLNITLHY